MNAQERKEVYSELRNTMCCSVDNMTAIFKIIYASSDRSTLTFQWMAATKNINLKTIVGPIVLQNNS